MSLPASFINAEHKTQDFYSQTNNFVMIKMAGMKVTAFEPVLWAWNPKGEYEGGLMMPIHQVDCTEEKP